MELGTFTRLLLSLIQLSLLAFAKELSQGEQDTDRRSSVSGSSAENAYRTDPQLLKKWKEVSVWGKRFDDTASDKKWDELEAWGKRNKKWQEMAVWGKRDSVPELHRKWDESTVLGQHGDDSDVNKRWKEMSVWGKRGGDSEGDVDLHKKWHEMSVWGKRASTPGMDAFKDGDSEVDKRWKEMSVWGKRDGTPKFNIWRHADSDMDKRWKEMSVWGKRDNIPELDTWKGDSDTWGKTAGESDMDKRWKEMSVWGKRAGDLDKMMIKGQYPSALDLDKKWKEMAVWGKRSQGKPFRCPPGNSLDCQSLEKRWKEMAVWGKRYIDPELLRNIQKHLLNEHAQNAEQIFENHGESEPIEAIAKSPDKGSNQEPEWSRREMENGAGLGKGFDKKWQEMAVWGKRDANTLNTENTLDQSSDGLKSKRSTDWSREQERWAQVRQRINQFMSRKRPSWSNTGFNSWGKRSDGMAATGPQ